jgi:hypothetical protein
MQKKKKSMGEIKNKKIQLKKRRKKTLVNQR